MAPFSFDNTYASLPERFYHRQPPRPVTAPRRIRVNRPLALDLGVDPGFLDSEQGVAVVAGNRVPEGAAPLAMAYAGHQFGAFNPRLGDGRALLLGEVVTADGRRFDLHLKGSGVTPFSRGGDGRSPLGPVLREYVVSEAMAALGVPTTRSLAAVTTGEAVYRDRPLPGAVLLRVAQSHVRVGTFEYFAVRRDREALGLLVDHVVSRHFPECARAEHPALALLDRVAERQAELVARWQLLGFIHGVMNTDNVLVSGETIDYGPCAFLDSYDPAKVFSSIDHGGRYAYGNQPAIAQWNVACLARALLPLLPGDDAAALDEAEAILEAFPQRYTRALGEGLARKLGFVSEEPGDAALGEELLRLMDQHDADFTLTFRRLGQLVDATGGAEGSGELEGFPEAFGSWLERWRARVLRGPVPPGEVAARMRAVNPALIPRNHLVEEAIRDAEDDGDFRRFHALVDALTQPYRDDPRHAPFAAPPRPEQRVRQTFCGT